MHLPSATPVPSSSDDLLQPGDGLLPRHLGPNDDETARMLAFVGQPSLDALADAAVPASIRLRRPLELPGLNADEPLGERAVLGRLRAVAAKNKVFRSFLGAGYSDTVTPPVILRNILENPAWYTSYTPYQAEISQGRLEMLLNFQTMITDLTGMEIANASLLDEATAAAEAMGMAFSLRRDDAARTFLVSSGCHPQTIDVVKTRAEPLGIQVSVLDDPASGIGASAFGLLLQYPETDGRLSDPSATLAKARGGGPPLGRRRRSPRARGPHAAGKARRRRGRRQRPAVRRPARLRRAARRLLRHAGRVQAVDAGRLVGVSKDAQGNPALRLALQTREQHIRRDKATSNICTAQVLLANIAAAYAVYHGPGGLRRIARRVHFLAKLLAAGARKLGDAVPHAAFFDTVRIDLKGGTADAVLAVALGRGINLRKLGPGSVGIALDEASGPADVDELLEILAGSATAPKVAALRVEALKAEVDASLPAALAREGEILSHPVFRTHHTETEMLRYLRRLELRDFSLATSMIPLGSCTMKLNATTEMIPVTWPEFGRIHPFAPREQAAGYAQLFSELEAWLSEITGFPAVSLQPNAGSQGEYAGLLAIRDYYAAKGEAHRNVCLIPVSAHGTNPASAAMAGFKIVPVACDASGNIDVADLRAKAGAHQADLAALMVTYPSTHGVFEEAIADICRAIHAAGGQVYMDGANMNAQVGLCRPGDIGADVCHLNLHKTFCIPHGGGGPGVGPIGVAAHLAPFLPRHAVVDMGGEARHGGAVSAAPWGSASILVISWAYIAMLGAGGLKKATQVAILNANYVARRLGAHFPVLYKGHAGLVAHECIVDLRQWKKAGIEVEDAAKRLIDYGFHAPTMSFPVPGTLMIEPTESESKEELDRFCDAMIAIRREIDAVVAGGDPKDNVLKNAPHTAGAVAAADWSHPYSREEAAFPTAAVRASKVWPAVARIDNVYGDRNLVCSCPPMESYSEES